MKGYKVTDSRRGRTVGVAAASLTQLHTKGKDKLGLTGDWVLALEDGTLVQDPDYFLTLPSHTLLIFYRPDEPIVTGVDLILNVLKSVNSTYLKVSTDVAKLMENKAEELITLLSNINETQPRGNTRKDDPEWFEGIETNAKTKEDFMFRKAQDRIRGYLYKFQDDVKKSAIYKDVQRRAILTDCVRYFKEELAKACYFGCYFDKRCAPVDLVDSSPRSNKIMRMNGETFKGNGMAYCDAEGVFTCQGLWKNPYCKYSKDHCINPYLNRESRVVFSTWNLDHRIEKSRTILPALLKSVESLKEGQELHTSYFFKLLFTKLNLKLVHIVCHDKGSHDIGCDENLAIHSL